MFFPFRDQKSTDSVRRQLKDFSIKVIAKDLHRDFTSRKIGITFKLIAMPCFSNAYPYSKRKGFETN